MKVAFYVRFNRFWSVSRKSHSKVTISNRVVSTFNFYYIMNSTLLRSCIFGL